jgi:mersacidin/lichenicidin family type 2 lantibiotic
MSYENIIRAWKDEAFRNSLSDKMRALLPENPAGFVQLTDAELSAAVGGFNSCYAKGSFDPDDCSTYPGAC